MSGTSRKRRLEALERRNRDDGVMIDDAPFDLDFSVFGPLPTPEEMEKWRIEEDTKWAAKGWAPQPSGGYEPVTEEAEAYCAEFLARWKQ